MGSSVNLGSSMNALPTSDSVSCLTAPDPMLGRSQLPLSPLSTELIHTKTPGDVPLSLRTGPFPALLPWALPGRCPLTLHLLLAPRPSSPRLWEGSQQPSSHLLHLNCFPKLKLLLLFLLSFALLPPKLGDCIWNILITVVFYFPTEALFQLRHEVLPTPAESGKPSHVLLR